MQAFDHDAETALLHTNNLLDLGDDADLVQSIRTGVIIGNFALRRQKDLAAVFRGVVERTGRLIPSDIEMEYHLREENQSA